MRTTKLGKQRHTSPIKPVSNGKRGQPTYYDPVHMPHMANVLCKEYGFTHEQLGKVFGVSKKTIDSWVLTKPEFQSAVRSGRDCFDSRNVEQKLLQRALGYRYTERTTKRVYVEAKDAAGKSVKIPGREVTITQKEVPPETKAIMYWLTNRQPERWKMAISIDANIKAQNNHPQVSLKADLSQLNKEQLLILRELVATQKTIDVSAQETLSIEHIMQKAEDATLIP